ncbi:MAG: hypothetical protein A2Z69_00485 [Bacteroidetes bacterium RBG_13_44_24]|nr:MAG: hypothetical protein A2Z69_00485 [Bacteroidetes bacterium RBG_13_44_24]
MLTLTSELEVLIATVLWLLRNGWSVEAISIARGRGLPPVGQQKEKIRRAFHANNAPFDEKIFRPKGPDIIASSHDGIWKIECKGLGEGRTQTHRNNFDRAVASVMSYFDNPQTRLGLALANDYLWVYHFSERLPQTLRAATNLWVFLLENGAIYPYEPTEELPFPGAV